ncbi:hypothetical protein GCM10010399_81700 [Dactylosporangium fulvum]
MQTAATEHTTWYAQTYARWSAMAATTRVLSLIPSPTVAVRSAPTRRPARATRPPRAPLSAQPRPTRRGVSGKVVVMADTVPPVRPGPDRPAVPPGREHCPVAPDRRRTAVPG